MDDTVAILDNYGSSRNAPLVKGCVVISDQPTQDFVTSALNRADASPHTPPSPSMMQQHQVGAVHAPAVAICTYLAQNMHAPHNWKMKHLLELAPVLLVV